MLPKYNRSTEKICCLDQERKSLMLRKINKYVSQPLLLLLIFFTVNQYWSFSTKLVSIIYGSFIYYQSHFQNEFFLKVSRILIVYIRYSTTAPFQRFFYSDFFVCVMDNDRCLITIIRVCLKRLSYLITENIKSNITLVNNRHFQV